MTVASGKGRWRPPLFVPLPPAGARGPGGSAASFVTGESITRIRGEVRRLDVGGVCNEAVAAVSIKIIQPLYQIRCRDRPAANAQAAYPCG